MLHDEPSQCSSSTDLTLSGASLCIRAKSANSDGWDYESSLEPAALQFSAGVDNSEIPPSPPHVPGDQYQTQASANAMIQDADDEICVVCLERAAHFQLLPCRHDSFCRQCIVETICTWVRPEAPSCPLCRGAFHTMVLLQ